MYETTEQKIKEEAKELQRFTELRPSEQEWLYLLLGKAEKRAVEILRCLSDCPLSYTEIAKLMIVIETLQRYCSTHNSGGRVAFRSEGSNEWRGQKADEINYLEC